MRFGGEDQSSAMAGNAQAAAKAKATIKEVAKEIVKEAKNTNQRQNRPSKRWQKKGRHMPKNNNKRNNAQIKQTVEKDVSQKLRKEGLEGPRSRFSVRVSATIGKIGPNKEQGPELQIATFMHPSLMKEPNDGTNFGPLQAAAAQWGLWRLSSLEIRFTPLVGPSAVTGSVYRVSLNLTQSPGNASWGGLGARKHKDIPVGRSVSWRLQRGDLAGPRQTWWMTDTNEEGGQSCGPMVEVHGLGKTSSTYQNQDWSGDLFIVEVNGKWEFTNYNAKPALGTLDRKSEDFANDSQAPGIEVAEDGVMKMTIPSASALSRFMSDNCERSPLNEGSVGETIWQIVDEGAGLASNLAPTPFSWLIKGAWWFVKKLAGRGANADEQYIVYASLADAQNNKPVLANRFPLTKKATTLTVTQVNSPNVGPGVTQSSYHTETPYPLVPVERPPPAGSTVAVMGQFYPLLYAQYNRTTNSVVKALPRFDGGQYLFQIKRGSNTCFAQAAYRIRSYTCVTLQGDRITGCYDPGWFNNTGFSFHMRGSERSFGQVIGYSIDTWGPSSAPFTVAIWLVRVTATSLSHDWTAWSYVSGLYIAGGSGVNPPIQVSADKICVPAAANSGSTTHSQIYINQPQLDPDDLLVVYSIGVNRQSQPGLTTDQPVTGNTNDRVVSRSKDGTHGFWAHALTPVFPQSDFGVIKFNLPTGEMSDIDRIMSAIQKRFKLKPFYSDSESEDSPDGESADDEEDHTGSCVQPKYKLAKERMYEALRDSEWDHVDAAALISAISSAKMQNTTRGHAE